MTALRRDSWAGGTLALTTSSQGVGEAFGEHPYPGECEPWMRTANERMATDSLRQTALPVSDALHALHLVEDFAPPDRVSGGAPISTRLQIEALSHLCRVTVLAPRPRYLPLSRYAERQRDADPAGLESEPFPGVRVHRPAYWHLPLVWPLTTPLQLVLATLSCLRRHAPDAALLHGHRGYPMGVVAVLAGNLTGRPSVWTAHGSDVHAQATRGEARVRGPVRWALKSASWLIAVSQELRRIALELGADSKRVTYIPNGVDLRRFPPRTREDARRALGRDPARRLVVCAANLVPVKGHEVLLDAWTEAAEGSAGTDLVLLGDGPLRATLEARARASGIGDRVDFAGRIPYGDVPAWLAACDLLVLPSFGEGTPLIALEALASGRPVVGTGVGGTAEVLCSEEFGLLVPPGDSKALARALREAFSRTWSEDALRRRAQDFAWPKLAGEIRELYAAVLS